MRSARILAVLCCATLVSALAPGRADGDTIRFTHGGARKCVIIEETEESVRFLNSMGTVSMPRSRIESIERESEEANAKLREKWEQKKGQRKAQGKMGAEKKEGACQEARARPGTRQEKRAAGPSHIQHRNHPAANNAGRSRHGNWERSAGGVLCNQGYGHGERKPVV